LTRALVANPPAVPGARRVALAGMVALAVALGIGRFAFTPLLPLMLHEGRLDLHGGGLLASLNYAGYFVGALTSAWLRVRPAAMVRAGLLGTALLLIGMGLADDFATWGALRALAGVISAWAFVFASGWGVRRLAELHAPALNGVIYTGPGIGIVATGLLGGAIGRAGSQAGWIALGLVALVLLALVWRAFADDAPVATHTAHRPAATVPPWSADAYWLIGLYGLAGFGYIITATFLPVIARQALPGSPWPDLFWPLLGLAVIPGALIGARAPVHWDNRLLLAAGFAMQAVGVLVSVAWPSVAGFLLASALVGLPFTALTMFTVREARRLRGDAAAGLIGYATAWYGIGQIAGPLFAAPLAQRSGSFALPLLVAAGVLALGAVMFVWVWRRRR
jgi:predicted MFS family arabinose efflux permease